MQWFADCGGGMWLKGEYGAVAQGTVLRKGKWSQVLNISHYLSLFRRSLHRSCMAGHALQSI